MKKLFVLSILLFLSLLFFVGCDGIFHNLLILTIPDDGGMGQYDPDFISLVNNLNTPTKLEYWLQHYTTWESNKVKYTPYEFYLRRRGDCGDYAFFSCYILHYHGYEAYYVKIKNKYSDVGHGCTVFKNKINQPYKYSLFSNKSLNTTGKYGNYQFNFNLIGGCVGMAVMQVGWKNEDCTFKVHDWNYFGSQSRDL